MIRALLWRLFGVRCCGNCRYFAEGVGDGENDWAQGSCHVEPPRAVTYSAPPGVIQGGRSARDAPARVSVQSYWPPTTPAEFCGHHRRRLW